MEPAKAEPGPPAGGTRPRDPPLLLRSYPTETAAGFPGLLRRHPALDHVPQQADRRTHQGRRGPPPGWLATDITGRLYTATASTATQGATDRKQELVRTAPAPAHRAAAAPRRGPRAERPPQAAAAAEQVGTGAPNQLTVPSARRTYADERAGLASERRRVSLGGWPVSESATQQRQQLRRRDSAGHVQQQNFSSSTAAYRCRHSRSSRPRGGEGDTRAISCRRLDIATPAGRFTSCPTAWSWTRTAGPAAGQLPRAPRVVWEATEAMQSIPGRRRRVALSGSVSRSGSGV